MDESEEAHEVIGTEIRERHVVSWDVVRNHQI
jgi:hypothetical protein